MGLPLPTRRCLPSSQPQVCSKEPCPGPPASSQPTLGTSIFFPPVETPGAPGQQPYLSFPGGTPLPQAFNRRGAERGRGLSGESLWSAWQVWGGIWILKGPPRQCNYSSNVKTPRNPRPAALQCAPDKGALCLPCKAPPTPQAQEGAEPELLPARPSPALLTQASQPGS